MGSDSILVNFWMVIKYYCLHRGTKYKQRFKCVWDPSVEIQVWVPKFKDPKSKVKMTQVYVLKSNEDPCVSLKFIVQCMGGVM